MPGCCQEAGFTAAEPAALAGIRGQLRPHPPRAWLASEGGPWPACGRARNGSEVQVNVCPVKKVQGGTSGQKSQHVQRAGQSEREKRVRWAEGLGDGRDAWNRCPQDLGSGLALVIIMLWLLGQVLALLGLG